MTKGALCNRFIRENETTPRKNVNLRCKSNKPTKELRSLLLYMTKYYQTNAKYYAWLVHQGTITFPIARWVYLVNTDPKLARYRGSAADYLEAIIDILWHPKFEEQMHVVGDEIFYDNDLAHVESGDREYIGEALPFNMQNAAGRTFVLLYLITGEDRFRERAAGLARFFKNRLDLVTDEQGERYCWRYRTYGSWNAIEDVAHASTNIDFACYCYNAGIVFDETDMNRFFNTFKHICHGADGTNDNVGGGNYIYDPGARYEHWIGLWMRLAHIEPSIRATYWAYYNVFKDILEWDNVAMPALAQLVETFPGNRVRRVSWIDFGDKAVGDELSLVEPNDGWTEYSPKGGIDARRTKRAGDLYFYLDIGDKFANTSRICITIRYYDDSNDYLLLHYDCTDGTTCKVAGSIRRTATNTWKSWSVYISDAALTGGMSKGADFRIGREAQGKHIHLDTVTVSVVSQGPGLATSPVPFDGFTGVDIDRLLNWHGPNGAVSYDVYFGPVNPPPFQRNQVSTSFDPGVLLYESSYFWRIDPFDGSECSTGDVWSFTTQPEPIQADMTNPAGGAVLSGPSQLFQWDAGVCVERYYIKVGSKKGDTSIYNGWSHKLLSELVKNIPSDGRDIFVRLGSRINGKWKRKDFQYKAFNSEFPGMLFPSPMCSLTGATAAFNWSAGSRAESYYLKVGNFKGDSSIHNGWSHSNLSVTVNDIPTDGRFIYVRLGFKVDGKWRKKYTKDYKFKAFDANTPGLLAPIPGSRLPGSTVTFEWSAGTDVERYYIKVGNHRCDNSIYNGYSHTNLSETVTGIPTDGRTIYVRLGFKINGKWKNKDYTFNPAPG